MKKELEEKLYSEFPQLFRDRKLTIYQSPMAWGVACGDGWYDLIRKACQKIMALNPPEEVRFAQVKEKYGGLRIYLEVHHEETSKIIDEAEREASKTCEWCGSTEDVEARGGGWITTLCEGCNKKSEEGFRPWRENR